MYIATTEIHTIRPKRSAKQKVCAAVPLPTAAPIRCDFGLSLPIIPANVPSSFVTQGNPLDSSLTLLTFIDAGLVSESDIPEKWQANDTIIKKALTHWTAKNSDKLTVFNMNIIYSEKLEDLITDTEIDHDALIEACDCDCKQGTINFGIYANSCEEVYVGEKVELLEKAVPGFGKTVVTLLSKATCGSSMYCVTPRELLGMCQYNYWRGEEDETEILEEMKAEMEEEDFEVAKEEVIKKSDLFRYIPEWAVECDTTFSLEEIMGLAENENDLVAQTAKALIPVMELVNKEERSHSVGVADCHIAPALLIRWNKDDPTYQIFDDHYRYLCEGECSNEIHRYFIANHDPEQLKETIGNMGKFIDDTAAVETLLRLIMEA